MILKKYAIYNYWANQRMLNLLSSIDNNNLNQEIVSSFTSIRKTFYHIWDAETIWYERITNNLKSSWPPSKIFDSETPIVSLLDASENLLKLVQSSAPEFFLNSTTYKDSKGTEHKTNNEEILQHVFNHSTLHRGQIITLLRQVGVTNIPSTDFITFVRSQA